MSYLKEKEKREITGNGVAGMRQLLAYIDHVQEELLRSQRKISRMDAALKKLSKDSETDG